MILAVLPETFNSIYSQKAGNSKVFTLSKG